MSITRINSSSYLKEGKADIDGNIWTIKVPGVGTEYSMRQVERESKLYAARIDFIDKKIADNSVSEEDLNNYQMYIEKFAECEKEMLSILKSLLRDETEDNSEVSEWIESQPSFVISQIFDDIREQASARTEQRRTSEDS